VGLVRISERVVINFFVFLVLARPGWVYMREDNLLMKKFIYFTIVGLIFNFSLTFGSIAQVKVPSSKRSKEACQRVAPELKSELFSKKIQYGSPIFIRIFKLSLELEVWLKKENKYNLFKTYKICTYGSGTLGPKVKQGDGQAPEGFYYVTPSRMNPLSDFHLSFNLGYPNTYDRQHGRTGSALMVHGSCVSIGCYAMTDSCIEEIYCLSDAALINGQKYFKVHIFPFRMTDENMKKYANSKWLEFWKNLKEGYDFFEKAHNLPDVRVKDKRYIFS